MPKNLYRLVMFAMAMLLMFGVEWWLNTNVSRPDAQRYGVRMMTRSQGDELAKKSSVSHTATQPASNVVQQDGEIVGVPSTGEQGISETIEQIMARERANPFVFTGVRSKKPEHDLPPRPKRDNPSSPNVSQWPSLSGSNPPTTPLNRQTIGLSIAGPDIASSGYVPPDVMGDVGPTQVLMQRLFRFNLDRSREDLLAEVVCNWIG